MAWYWTQRWGMLLLVGNHDKDMIVHPKGTHPLGVPLRKKVDPYGNQAPHMSTLSTPPFPMRKASSLTSLDLLELASSSALQKQKKIRLKMYARCLFRRYKASHPRPTSKPAHLHLWHLSLSPPLCVCVCSLSLSVCVSGQCKMKLQ